MIVEDRHLNMLIKIDIQFFSAEDEGKTEKATPKKRKDAREKGQVAKSNELNTAFILLVLFGLLSLLGTFYIDKSNEIITKNLNNLANNFSKFDQESVSGLLSSSVIDIVITNGALWAGLFFTGIAISIAQVGWNVNFKSMKPDFKKMNPLKGIKKIASKDTLVELLKSLFKVGFLGVLIVSNVKDEIYMFTKLYDIESLNAAMIVGDIILSIGFSVAVGFIFLAILDFAYQKYKFEDGIKMSKQEIKDEYKQAEGDPLIKGKIRQKMREMSMKRMMEAIPSADVIITNPTHYAIAIQYEKDAGLVPRVVAKGVDFKAKQIREKAKECSVPIVENRLLARTLYSTVDIGEQIPPELYNAVAEVLAFVYSLNESK